jgi:hypothetical protein
MSRSNVSNPKRIQISIWRNRATPKTFNLNLPPRFNFFNLFNPSTFQPAYFTFIAAR